MEKVYCVFQSSGEYDMYTTELVCVCETEELAKEIKQQLDKKVVGGDDLFTIIPRNIYMNWTFTCIDEDNDEWIPDEKYEGYMKAQYIKQCERVDLYHQHYYTAEIKEYNLVKDKTK